MLNKQEVCVMQFIYKMCRKNQSSCILSTHRILQEMPENLKLNDKKIDSILKQLEYDGYLECTTSDKKGEIVNVINLKEKGKAFKREMVQRRREIVSNIFWRIVFAAVGAVVALVISKVFGG